MTDSCTVVIGAQKHLDALRERARADGEVLAFTDAEALFALEAITKRKPKVITLERLFAATPRGAALINRIKADPALISAEIRIMSHDGEYSRVSPRRSGSTPAANDDTPASLAPPLDYRGTRRSPRFRMADGTEAQVDGTPARLVDLSVRGAQVLAGNALKPNQRVRVTLADEMEVVRLNAAVAWASFEIPQGTTRYRAGIEFTDSKADAVEAFAKRHSNK